MTSARDEFLQRVRRAVSAGNRPGDAAAVPPRGTVGYQGAGSDLVARFRDELTAAGGQAHLVPDAEGAMAQVIELVQTRLARRVLLGRGAFIDTLPLGERLRAAGIEVAEADQSTDKSGRDTFFAADLGITGVDYLIAETGTVVLLARPGEPRSFSLLPPLHIAIAERGQLLPDLFDLFESRSWQERGGPTSGVSLITGPSKTGDIELRLVTGVHGPGEIHVVVVGS